MRFNLSNVMIYGIAKHLKRLSPSNRAEVLMRLIRLSSKNTTPKERLQFLFELENRLYSLEGKTSIDYGNGIHTKHRHINYHNFFIKNLKPREKVLDIGCGNGFMDYDIVNQVPNVKIVGIDMKKENINFACSHYKHANLKFVYGDALNVLPDETFDVIMLSNVLEHIEKRVEFLKRIIKQLKPKALLYVCHFLSEIGEYL